MLARFLIALILAAIISTVLFMVTIAFSPRSLTVLEPVFCEDWQTMAVAAQPQGQGSFALIVACTGDGIVPVSDLVYLAFFGLFFLPIFCLTWLWIYLKARADERHAAFAGGYTGGKVRVITPSSTPNVTVISSNVDTAMMTDVLSLLQDALQDGIITPDELERIKSRVNDSGQHNDLSARLAGLQDACSQGLITPAEYDTKRRQILDAF